MLARKFSVKLVMETQTPTWSDNGSEYSEALSSRQSSRHRRFVSEADLQAPQVPLPQPGVQIEAEYVNQNVLNPERSVFHSLQT